MPDPSRPLAEHQLTVIRAFLRHRVPLFKLIDRFDDELQRTDSRSTPAATAHAAPVARALLEGRALASLLSERLVDAIKRAGDSR
jgi:hypothetical protein